MKVKETVKKMGKETKKFYEENKFLVGYAVGGCLMIAIDAIWDNPKRGRFEITHPLNPDDPYALKINVVDINRFGAKCRKTEHCLPMENAEKMLEVISKHINQRKEILEGKED